MVSNINKCDVVTNLTWRVVAALTVAILPLLLAAKGKELPIDKLDPATRAKVLAALTGLVILWFALIALIWMGARLTRRHMKSRFDEQPRSPFAESGVDDWAAKPLAGPDNETNNERGG